MLSKLPAEDESIRCALLVSLLRAHILHAQDAAIEQQTIQIDGARKLSLAPIRSGRVSRTLSTHIMIDGASAGSPANRKGGGKFISLPPVCHFRSIQTLCPVASGAILPVSLPLSRSHTHNYEKVKFANRTSKRNSEAKLRRRK